MRDRHNVRPGGWPEWLDTTDHVGSHYPYYWLPRPEYTSLEIADVIERMPREERVLDLAGVIEMGFGHRLLGNRTLVRGVRRTPWMAEPTPDGWAYHAVPSHGTAHRPVDTVVDELQEALCREAKSYVDSTDDVGLLLSGGLDSRILAGEIRELQLEDKVGSVTAFTWGVDGSRDVVYARRVASEYDWPFEQIALTADLLWENVERTGEMGAEFAPYHLHGLPQVRARDDIDVVLAGSYGNSIGRGEYAGDHVTELEPTVPGRLNKFGVLSNAVVEDHRHTVAGDGYGYRDRIDRSLPYQYHEIERQLHYMRRGLQPCMTHVAERTPLYQLFTAPSVVELMWSLDPDARGLSHFEELLDRYPGSLLSIPDAKKGRIDGAETDSRHEQLAVRAHRYGTWLREDLRDDIVKCIREGPLVGRLFNEASLNRLLRVWPHASTTTMNRVDDVVSWLAALTIFVDRYDISVQVATTDSRDRLNGLVGPLNALAYQTARGFLRQ